MRDYLNNAEDRLHRYFGAGGWELYDGLPVAQNSTLTVADLLASVALNSGLDTRRQVWEVWIARQPIERVLDRIPLEASLKDADVPWDDLRDLMDVCCATRNLLWPVATKILHKKRPALIPVYDRHMWTFYKPQVPRQRSWSDWDGRWWVACLKVFREHLLEHRSEIHGLCELLARNGWHVTPVRVLEVLIWMAHEPTGEYR